MAAFRFTVRLYEGRGFRGEKEVNVDPTDVDAMRATLESMVVGKKGSLDLDLSRWSIVVHRLGGGQIRGRLKVRPNGLNQLLRR